VVAQGGRVRPEGDHRRDLVGVGRGQQQGQAAAGVATEEGHPPGPGGVQDAADVVHLVVEGVPGRAPVREAVAEAVEQEQPGERRQLAQEPGERRVLPQQTQVGRPPEQEHQVQIAVADDLVGQPAPVPAVGVGEGRAVAHARSVRG
jgi:hypothetical protein